MKGCKVEPVYTVPMLRRLFFPGRSPNWIKLEIHRGRFGTAVYRDGRGWQVPESGVEYWMAQHKVEVLVPR